MLIDHTHKKWMAASLALLAIAFLAELVYRLRVPQGSTSGTPLRLAYGIAAFGLMIFAGLLGARKKVPVWRVGRAQTWMRGHLWFGPLTLPLAALHAGFHFGGPLTTALLVVLFAVVASGIIGAVLQHHLPRMMTRDVPLETIFDEIESVRAQLLQEADELVTTGCGPLGLPASPNPAGKGAFRAKAGGATAGKQPPAAPVAVFSLAEKEIVPMRDFYLRTMRPFLETPGTVNHPLANRSKATGILSGLRKLMSPAGRETLKDLADICEEMRQLNHQVRLHRWMHVWLLVHAPLSFSLLMLAAVHALMSLHY